MLPAFGFFIPFSPFIHPRDRFDSLGGSNAAQEGRPVPGRDSLNPAWLGPAAIFPPEHEIAPSLHGACHSPQVKSPGGDKGAPTPKRRKPIASRRCFCFLLCCFLSARQPCTARALRSSFPATSHPNFLFPHKSFVAFCFHPPHIRSLRTTTQPSFSLFSFASSCHT